MNNFKIEMGSIFYTIIKSVNFGSILIYNVLLTPLSTVNVLDSNNDEI